MSRMPPLRVLIQQRLRGLWVARLVEHDIVAEGRNASEAIDALIRLVTAHIEFDGRHGRRPLSGFSPTSDRYADLFAWARELYTYRHYYGAGQPIDIRVSVNRSPAVWMTSSGSAADPRARSHIG